jgi:hypothetical protein
MTGMFYTPKEIEKIVNPSTDTSAFLNDAADMLSNPPYTAQQSVQRTVDQPCEKHNMEFCSECFPVVVVDFNRR